MSSSRPLVNSLRIFGVCALLLLPALAYCQIAYTCPPVPEDPNLAKVTLFRLLYAGTGKAPSICLVREPRGQKAAIIGTDLPAGTYTPYFVMRPERLTLHILDGKVTADPEKPLPLEEKKLTEPLKAELDPGSAHTLIVQENSGKISASLVADPKPEPSAPPVMRVIDLSGLPSWGVQLLNRKSQPIKTLWQSGAATEGISISSPGVYYVNVVRQAADGLKQIATFECQLDSGTACSVVLLPGRSGAGDAIFTFDGTLGISYDPEAIKTIANGR